MRFGATPLSATCLSLSVLTGCQSSGPSGITDIDVEPITYRDGSARSLALSSRTVRAIQVPFEGAYYEPWYAGRNDRHPGVLVDNTGVFEVSETFVIDQQLIYNGRVIDRYDQTTIRRTIREGYR